MVLFVGQSLPKGRAADEVPFDGTLSGKRLARWIETLRCPTHTIVNACAKPGASKASREDVAALRSYVAELKPEKVVALGAVAAKALDQAEVHHWKLPHPSGRNLKINDARAVQNNLEECRKWLVDAPFMYPVPIHHRDEEE
jgi:uracil-DNA glycosylase